MENRQQQQQHHDSKRRRKNNKPREETHLSGSMFFGVAESQLVRFS